jgi:tetratricopeptide (TPR) repeat protein
MISRIAASGQHNSGFPADIESPSEYYRGSNSWPCLHSCAFNQNRCDEALPLLDALAARPGLAKNTRIQAITRVRKGACLVRLDRLDEGIVDLLAALPALPADDPANREDLYTAHLALGRAAYDAFDYDNAAREFESAHSLAQGNETVECLVWLARALTFAEGPAAESYAAEALQAAQARGTMPPAELAALHTLHARALLNHRQSAAAYTELKDALRIQGGLNFNLTLDELVTRSDLALAAMINGDRDNARKYLAYAGAGRFEMSPLASAVSMDPPPCGGPAQLQADDFAVIEFRIDDQGSVGRVSPIYASRSGAVAGEFARAVAGWSWRPEDAAKIPGFFRLLTRIGTALLDRQRPSRRAQPTAGVARCLDEATATGSAVPEQEQGSGAGPGACGPRYGPGLRQRTG